MTGCSGPTPIENCESSTDIHVICNLAKPEDLAALPGTPWVLISELGNGPDPGHVVALRPADERLVRLHAADPDIAPESTFPRCGPPPSSLKPRGFHLSTDPAGGAHLLIVNVVDEARIERYQVTAGDVPELHWEGCVAVPEDITPNDVAAIPDGGFVVSHMYTPPRTRLLEARLLLRLDTGYVMRWHPRDGWQKIAGTDAALPNGVETDPVTGRVFMAATHGQNLTVVDPDGGNRKLGGLPVQTDNLTWAPDGRLLAVGHTGIPIFGTRACREMGSTSCAFPFAVAAIDPATLAVETIYAHSDGLIPGPSVALIDDGQLYLGTFFGDRISRVALPADQ